MHNAMVEAAATEVVEVCTAAAAAAAAATADMG
jgi:hypothetical protein